MDCWMAAVPAADQSPELPVIQPFTSYSITSRVSSGPQNVTLRDNKEFFSTKNYIQNLHE